MKTLVIVPAYNEEKKIAQVVSEILREGFEVLVVDDGSGDKTAEQAKRAGALVLSHLVNLGQGAALQTGFDYAKNYFYDIAITFDADGQHSALEINKVIEPLLLAGHQVVLGSRFINQSAVGLPFFKKVVLKLATIFTRLSTGLKVTDAHNGFRALSLAALQKINLRHNGMAHASEILSQIALHQIKYREIGVTISYTDYSKAKGQPLSNSFRILWELFWEKIK